MVGADAFQMTIIGAGVVGLAVAEELTRTFQDVLVLEKNISFGQETSSRNSEVIHAGLYYPPQCLKTSLCVQGNRLLYETCRKRGIPHKKVGKLIVAAIPEECQDLETIWERAQENGVTDLVRLAKKQAQSLEPAVKTEAALFSPSTGIIDTHSLMRSFLTTAQEQGAVLAFRSCVTAIRLANRCYEVEINNGEYHFTTKLLINCAGLHADKIAALAGMDIDKLSYRLKFCKGNYFTLAPAPRLRHLVYPVPAKNNEALGIHATLDLQNRVRFGPDIEYVRELEYSVDDAKKENFYRAIKKYLPAVELAQLQPDMSGIRPKLQGPNEPYRDFIIREERDNGFPGLINLIGIESPGLTASMAIGRYIAALAEKSLG